MDSLPSQNERMMAAIAHGSVVLTGSGIAVAVLIWLTQKEKSAYVAGQALQAAVYQLLGLIVMMVLWVAYTVLVVVATIPIAQYPEQYENAPPPFFWISMASMIIPMAFMLVWWLYGLWGALKSWQGKPFRYALIGRRLMEVARGQ